MRLSAGINELVAYRRSAHLVSLARPSRLLAWRCYSCASRSLPHPTHRLHRPRLPRSDWRWWHDPALWALRHSTNCDFEVSVVAISGNAPWRKGLEALAIGLYRQQHGRSPTVNFG